ncbi:AAA domain (dynein-related subfamily) [Desulfacinum hydrothermale DSM 13146]|uniref:AAA domain (Dynein-related subfamily) n=1 Tax=Desulfacinum hydrothermale DSM 13146 TaxID=1121390 RepID=A0A1W1XID6_9BACT|nr:AAA family ATPase [Desulfacinum hydrothermale]SMC23755.1 AAA domain (dynein-related subfamily) [Desulfacinum hydrothermale DSM 13146]
MSRQLFIFTAGNPEARKHLEDTIENHINLERIIGFFGPEEQEELRNIDRKHHLYAWGAVPGPNNERLWGEIKPEDYMLCVYNKTYQYVAEVLKKTRNEKCARELWGSDADGKTWELMYFLSKPRKIQIPVQNLSRYLNRSYRGFTKISQDKVQNIIKEFGDLKNFINKQLINPRPPADPESPEPPSPVEKVINHIQSRGFVYEPWQIAQYITAIRTKPFVILAGISGTGKSKLPALVAEATGGKSRLVPVRPDWTDSSDILGYVDLQGAFRPGALLELALEAMNDKERFWTCIIDEMNLARVEYYFAEILSKIEDRKGTAESGYKSDPLLGQSIKVKDTEWMNVILPPNLCLVGTVNMDETSHGFSRKVLDRAFTIEISEVHLDSWEPLVSANMGAIVDWPPTKWYPRAIRLPELRNLKEEEEQEVIRAVDVLKEINKLLIPAQLQVGYRTRDEVALFLIHANEIRESFTGSNGEKIDPLDLALQMKILPRIVGGSTAIRQVVLGLLGWAMAGEPYKNDEDARPIFEDWENAGRPMAITEAKYPRFAARLCLMWERLLTEGYTSYWL